MSETDVAIPDLRTKEGKAWKATQGGATAAADNPTTKRQPKILPYDEFMLRFFTENSQSTLATIKQYPPEEAAGVLAGLSVKTYEAYRLAIMRGWAAFGE